MIQLTEKFLLSLGGWQVWKEAKAMHAAGRVVETVYAYPDLKGKLTEGGKQFLAGFHFRSATDVDNLCSCRDSHVRGIVCAHSLAVGLQVLYPDKARLKEEEYSSAFSKISKNHEETLEEPTVELTIEGSLRHLEVDVYFRYSRQDVVNSAREREVLMQLLESGFQEWKGKAAIQGEDAILRFFAGALPKLKQKWKVKEGERFQNVTRDLVHIEPQFALRQRDDGWLDFHLHYTAGKDAIFSQADIQSLLRTGQGHIQLKDGRVAVANAAHVSELEEILHDCNPQQECGRYRVPPRCQGYLEASISQWKGEKKAHASLSEKELGTLRTKLRPYQIQGALWLLERARMQWGGLLADEMGLGKTVQALALIEVLTGPVLVVCPSSLVWNWKREAKQFLPDLSVLALSGPDREKFFAEIPKYRLIVTSYALLRRDIEHYKDHSFSAVILDEAQHIKNPESQNAKAAYALHAKSRFILTGTPVENSIRDLWSLFEFFLPGYLGSQSDFRERYEAPILNGERGPLWQRLTRRLQPYLLRRKKQEILADLPDKIEQILEVELTDSQKGVYAQLQQVARSQIDRLQEQEQSGAARMQVLTALLRLRQACCDLRLLNPSFLEKEPPQSITHNPQPATGNKGLVPPTTFLEMGASAKLAALLELLEEAIDGNHRVLVFSQFTSMLDLIEDALQKQKITYCRLDGSTKNREGIVTQFQETAEIPVFLISLKAGGVGLNLTAADMVILFDPWWNPAVEAQAVDRAHRIGQKRVVTSIKLIARDTIEERVLRLQEKKRKLLEGMVDSENSSDWFEVDELRELVG